MSALSDLVLSHGDETDGTSYPIWFISVKGFSGRHRGELHLAGPWFNRKEATEYLEGHRYRYPKTARVFCESGHNSPHVRRLYELARQGGRAC